MRFRSIEGPDRLQQTDTKLRAAFGAAHEENPRLAKLYGWMVRNRYAVAGAVAALHGTYDDLGYVNHDIHLFAAAGRKLLFEGSLDVFEKAAIQVGPLYLVFSGIAGKLAQLTGLKVDLVVAVIVEPAFVVGCMLVLRMLLRDRGRASPSLELYCAVVVIFGGFAWMVGTSSHPMEGAIALLWIVAARDLSAGRSLRGGALIGLAGGLKLWGVLGIPLVWLAVTPKSRSVAAAAAGALVVAAYGPFFLFGDVATFTYSWIVTPQSPIGFFLEWHSKVTWTARVVQGLAVVGLGSLWVRSVRSSAHAVWAAPLGIISIRLLFDPLVYHYYWLALGTVALIGVLIAAKPGFSIAKTFIALGFYVMIGPLYFANGYYLASWITALCLGSLYLTWRVCVSERDARDAIASTNPQVDRSAG